MNMKMKKNITLMALFAVFSTQTSTQAMDPLTIGVIAAGVAVVSVIYAYTPYTCAKCHLFINDVKDGVIHPICGRHSFHGHCYDARERCLGCVAEEREYALREQVRRDEAIREDERNRILRQQERDREAELRRAREYQETLQERARKRQQAWETKLGEQEAQRVAQEESRNARGGYTTPAQAKADQQEEHGYTKAMEIAQQEARMLQQRQAEAAARRVQEQQEQELNNRKKQVFDREQATIKSIPWMMEECSICLAPRAQRDENSEVLLDLKKHPQHVTALPCGHVFHTTCIKKAAERSNRCPLCNTEFKVRDL